MLSRDTRSNSRNADSRSAAAGGALRAGSRSPESCPPAHSPRPKRPGRPSVPRSRPAAGRRPTTTTASRSRSRRSRSPLRLAAPRPGPIDRSRSRHASPAATAVRLRQAYEGGRDRHSEGDRQPGRGRKRPESVTRLTAARAAARARDPAESAWPVRIDDRPGHANRYGKPSGAIGRYARGSPRWMLSTHSSSVMWPSRFASARSASVSTSCRPSMRFQPASGARARASGT